MYVDSNDACNELAFLLGTSAVDATTGINYYYHDPLLYLTKLQVYISEVFLWKYFCPQTSKESLFFFFSYFFFHFQFHRVGQSELHNMLVTIKIQPPLDAQNTCLVQAQAKFPAIISIMEMDTTWQIKIKKFVFVLKEQIVGRLSQTCFKKMNLYCQCMSKIASSCSNMIQNVDTQVSIYFQDMLLRHPSRCQFWWFYYY